MCFWVKRFYAYLFGHLYELVTDNNSLLGLLGEHTPTSLQASAIIGSFWKLFCAIYDRLAEPNLAYVQFWLILHSFFLVIVFPNVAQTTLLFPIGKEYSISTNNGLFAHSNCGTC